MTEPRLFDVMCLDNRCLHRMAYAEWGDAANPKLLLCLHGLTRQGRDFDTLARALAGEYRVVCHDVVGRGRSDWLADPMGYAIPQYVADMVNRFRLNEKSHVVEIAANDGYLLQYVKARGIPCLGIEPTASTASAAKEKGLEVIEAFFGVELAKKLASEGKQADLTAANNVLAHVPDINDFVEGFSHLLKPNGVATFEFPHLMQLVKHTQFDTIYHEHFSYLSLTAVNQIFNQNGLQINHWAK